jgi:hypothetical protein
MHIGYKILLYVWVHRIFKAQKKIRKYCIQRGVVRSKTRKYLTISSRTARLISVLGSFRSRDFTRSQKLAQLEKSSQVSIFSSGVRNVSR